MSRIILEENEIAGLQKISKSSMNSAILESPGKIKWKAVGIASPGTNQIRVKIEGCGLCSSSIPVWEGREWFNYPQEAGSPGHEAWGVVDEVGDDVSGLNSGDRVAMLSYNGFAEYDIAEAGNVVKLPPTLSSIPFPGEPLGCAMNIFERSDIKKGQTVAIVGIGFLGAILVQLAKGAGAKVIAISQRPFSLKIAQESGADLCIALDDHQKIIDKVSKETNGNFCDRVIEATGKEWPLNLAGELTKIRGKLIIAGFHQDGMRSVNIQLWNWRGIDVINAHERDPAAYVDGMQKAVDAYEAGSLQYFSLITHIFTPEELEQAFEMMVQRPEGFVKAIIKF